MGIDRDGTEFLAFARRVGVSFTSTLTLGWQAWETTADNAVAGLEAHGIALGHADRTAIRDRTDASADMLLRLLGATEIEALDASGFEGATIIHDLNRPSPSSLHDRFSCVIDGGTLEHVFSFPAAIETAMRAVAPGGHLIAVSPLNNQAGHGFYQFSPELFFRVLSPENGFEVRYALVRNVGLGSAWRLCTDPAQLGARVEPRLAGQTSLYVLARRTGTPGLARVPQQSDYEERWGTGEERPDPSPRSKLIHRLPRSSRERLRDLRRSLPAAGAGLQRVTLGELAAADPEVRSAT